MDMFSHIKSRPKVVASFSAILAMIKRGAISVFQLNQFDDIELVATEQLYQGDIHYDESEFTGVLDIDGLGTTDGETQVDS
ncbi:MAG: hypothetical protein R3A11_03345 [Bdellovibrionota bacterium]